MSELKNNTRPNLLSCVASDDINLLFAKIFHDLVSPLNTISLGIDSLDGAQDNAILACVKDSTKNVLSLVETFRFCLSNTNQECSKFEFEHLLKNIRENIKLVTSNEMVNTKIAQMICLMMFTISSMIPKSEMIICDVNCSEHRYVFYIKLGKNLVTIPDLKISENTARNILWNIALKYAQVCGLKLWIEKNEDLTTFLVCSVE